MISNVLNMKVRNSKKRPIPEAAPEAIPDDLFDRIFRAEKNAQNAIDGVYQLSCEQT